jgi:hypothetical protein
MADSRVLMVQVKAIRVQYGDADLAALGEHDLDLYVAKQAFCRSALGCLSCSSNHKWHSSRCVKAKKIGDVA